MTLEDRLVIARAFTHWCLKHPKYAASVFARDAFIAGWTANQNHKENQDAAQ